MINKIIIPIFLFLLFLNSSKVLAQSFSLESVLSYPFPTELTSSSSGSRIALAMNEKGLKNVYVAEGPDFSPRRLTTYNKDYGQEISSLTLSDDGKWIVFVRGGSIAPAKETRL